MANRASRRAAVVLVVLAIGFGLFARAFLASGVSAGNPLLETADERASAAPAPAADAPRGPGTLAVPSEAPAPPLKGPEAAASAAPPERATASTPEELELADALWVSGSLRFPEGTPLGETVEVIAQGKKFKHREAHRARVAPDGSFRVAFAKETRSGKLAIDAKHLYLSKPLAVKPAETSSGLVLEPELGGCITGTIVPPDGAADAGSEFEKSGVTLWSWRGMTGGENVQRASKVDASLRFELRGVPAGANCVVSCDTKSWAPAQADNVAVTAGADTQVELRLRRGVHVSGIVLDDAGQPVPGAELMVSVEDEHGRSSAGGELSSKEGKFDLPGQAPGVLSITAQKKGYVDAKLVLGKLADGDAREALELKLGSGSAISGRVVWPDGKPVEKAQVSAVAVEQDDEHWRPPEALQFPTAADGTFTITGLGASPVDVVAYANARGEEAPSDPAQASGSAPASKKSSARKTKWTAKLEKVTPGAAALVLTLHSGYALTGRVVDDSGAPVKSFQIVATPAEEESGPRAVLARPVLGRSSDDGGEFTLEGVPAGAWSVEIKAKGFTSGEPTPALVPDQQALGTLVVTRCAILRGVVLGPDGKPAARASVSISAPRERDLGMMFDDSTTVKSDSQGRFEFKSSPAGELVLRAARDGFAGSAELPLSVAPAQTLEGLTLALRRGGRLNVQLLAAAGAPNAARQLNLYAHGGGGWRETRTDASGNATVEGLDPGEWEVMAEPSEEEVKALGVEPQSDDYWQLRSSLQKRASVTIVEGETANVVLGAAARAPVEVSGVVRSGGSPLAGARVNAYFRREDSGESESTKFARSDSKGAYRMKLDHPGKYSFAASSEGTWPSQWKEVEVPDAATFVVDLDLPSGSIAGRVIGPDGAPVSEAWVQVTLEHAEQRSHGVDASGQTDEAGAFRIQNLPAGEYRVTATGAETSFSSRGRETRSRSLSRETVRGVSLAEGGAVRDVELRLQVGGTLEGFVLDASGQPARNVFVTLRDASGAARDDFSTGTDAKGHYECGGLAAGEWTVRAMREGELSAERSVRIAVEQTTRADLELRAGTQLSVQVFDKDGTAVGASLSVRDSRGREMTLWRTGGGDHGEPQLVGPLAPGQYTVTATNHDGNQASAQVTLSSEPTRSLRLTFD